MMPVLFVNEIAVRTATAVIEIDLQLAQVLGMVAVVAVDWQQFELAQRQVGTCAGEVVRQVATLDMLMVRSSVAARE